MSKNPLESKQRAFQENVEWRINDKEVWCHSTKVGVTVICSRWMVGIVPRPVVPVSPEGLLGAILRLLPKPTELENSGSGAQGSAF